MALQSEPSEKLFAGIEKLLNDDDLTGKIKENAGSIADPEAAIKIAQEVMKLAKNNSIKNYVFAPQNVGPNVNTTESEYFPSLTIDAKELIFTRRLKGVNEDFYYSKSNGGQWDPAKPIEGDINTPMSEAAQNISSDGQWLVFTGCYRPDGMGGCDLYISYKTENGWSEAINLGGNINSDQWESQPCLSPDKRDLYFASKRNGGYGGSDIYGSVPYTHLTLTTIHPV